MADKVSINFCCENILTFENVYHVFNVNNQFFRQTSRLRRRGPSKNSLIEA